MTEGEKVVGNWYRIYRGVGTDGETYPGFTNSGGTQFFAFKLSADESRRDCFLFVSGPNGWSDDMQVVITDDYIDIYVESGTFTATDGSHTKTITIDEDAVITSFYAGYVKKLAFSAEE